MECFYMTFTIIYTRTRLSAHFTLCFGEDEGGGSRLVLLRKEWGRHISRVLCGRLVLLRKEWGCPITCLVQGGRLVLLVYVLIYKQIIFYYQRIEIKKD